MSLAGRPLRFLLAVSIGWVGLRAVMLWPALDPPPPVIRAIVPVAATKPSAIPVESVPMPAPHRAPVLALSAIPANRIRANPIKDAPAYPALNPDQIAVALLGLLRVGTIEQVEVAPQIVAGLPPSHAPSATASRWSGSAWAVVRDGAAFVPGLGGGQLGGSQAGARLAFARDRRLALAMRVSGPLRGGTGELAAGIEWRPTSWPIRLVAEQRIALDGAPGGTVVGAVGGIGPRSIARGIRGEAYAQGGFIARRGAEGFVDGAVRLSHPLAVIEPARFDLGAGAWGAAQRGAARIDIGPSLSASLPIGGTATRLSLDWRERVVGRARPGSGLVVTLGTDF